MGSTKNLKKMLTINPFSKPIMGCCCCQTPVPSPDFSLGLGVDFVLPLSQEQQEQQEQEQEPHQNIPEGSLLKIRNLANKLYSSNTDQMTTPPLYFYEKIFRPKIFDPKLIITLKSFRPKINF